MDSKPTNATSGAKRVEPDEKVAPAEAPRRVDRLATIVDLCLEARQTAQDLDEKLLAYLLAMAVQETRAAMRKQVTATAGTVKLAARRPGARRAAT